MSSTGAGLVHIGFQLPLQVLPELHIDLNVSSVKLRIQKAIAESVSQPTGGARKPRADPLVPTYELILALHNMLKSVFDMGLMMFMPTVRSAPLRAGRWVTDAMGDHPPPGRERKLCHSGVDSGIKLRLGSIRVILDLMFNSPLGLG